MSLDEQVRPPFFEELKSTLFALQTEFLKNRKSLLICFTNPKPLLLISKGL